MRYRFRFDLPVLSVRTNQLILDMGNGVSATFPIAGLQSDQCPAVIPAFLELPAAAILEPEAAEDV